MDVVTALYSKARILMGDPGFPLMERFHITTQDLSYLFKNPTLSQRKRVYHIALVPLFFPLYECFL